MVFPFEGCRRPEPRCAAAVLGAGGLTGCEEAMVLCFWEVTAEGVAWIEE